MRMLGTRFPNSSQNGTALTPDGNLGSVADSIRQLSTYPAIRPLSTGTLPETRQAHGSVTLLYRTQESRTHQMTLPKPVVLTLPEGLESPQDAIDIPVAFPCEPETKQDTCPILRPHHGDLIPEEAPVIAKTAIETVTATAIETVTALAVAAREAASNPEAAGPAGADRGGNPNGCP